MNAKQTVKVGKVSDLEVELEFNVSSFATYYIYTIQSGNFTALSHTLRRHHISVMTWRVLALLQERDGNNISYLAGRLAIDRSNLSRIIDSMVKDGLVARENLPNDRRNVLVYLTDAGKKKVHDALPDVLAIVEATTEGFTDEENELLISLLRRMKENVFGQVGR